MMDRGGNGSIGGRFTRMEGSDVDVGKGINSMFRILADEEGLDG